MLNGKTFRLALDKFFESPVVSNARVQVELPNGKLLDVTGLKLLENRMLGDFETHRLVFTCREPKNAMGPIIGKL
tara:strand:- start:224 stop:448 length:225 start_codon:yes stop_codon:yes gene_type:complete